MSMGVRVAKITNVVTVVGRSIVLPVTGFGAPTRSEAEFYVCVEAVKEVPFIAQILLFLEISVDLPIRVRVDNVGAIFMSDNVTSGC